MFFIPTTDCFNSIWESGIFPPSWREATVVAIPKSGKDSTDPNNYRPIALTSCLRKTMERMVNNLLMWVLESKGLLASEQCGFRKNPSTADHLARFDSYIGTLLTKKKTWLPFSLIWKKLTTPEGNKVYHQIFTTLIFDASCLPSLMGFCPIDCFRWEIGPLCLILRSGR